MKRRSSSARSRPRGAEEEPLVGSALANDALRDSLSKISSEDAQAGSKRDKKRPAIDATEIVQPQPVRAPVANLSLARRERRALVRERERRIRDLGGLLLEMYRRDQFREDLILEHCAQAMGIENRIHELESILSRSRRRGATSPRCTCGAPIFFGARFCASCGRPTDLASAGTLCARCSQPLAAGTCFCASCGIVVESDIQLTQISRQTISSPRTGTTPGESQR